MGVLSIPLILLWDELLFVSGHEEAENAYADFLCDFDAILGDVSEKGRFFY